MNMIISITTLYGLWMDDEEVIYHVNAMHAGTPDAACACDTCELCAARTAGCNAVVLPDGSGVRLVYDATQIPPSTFKR